MSFSTLLTSGATLESIQVALETSSHNIANVNTNAYKKKQVSFEDIVANNSSFSGATVNRINTDFGQGAIKSTGAATNLALHGDGFFTLQGGDGNVYFSRTGDFGLDASGSLVDPNGNFVLSTGGSKITIPTDTASFGINSQGEVLAQANGAQPQVIAQVQLASFTNVEGLGSKGGNLYSQTVASGAPVFSTALSSNGATADTAIVAGAVESSNVDLSTAFVDLIAYQRSFQAVSKAVTTSDELLEVTLGLS